MRTKGSFSYYLTDAQGSVIGLVNAAGTKVDTYTYDPTGNARTTTQTAPQSYRFQGTYLTPTGLYGGIASIASLAFLTYASDKSK